METKPYCFCFDCGQYIKPIEGVPQVCRNEKNSGGGGLPIKKYCRPPWLVDEENFSFQIV